MKIHILFKGFATFAISILTVQTVSADTTPVKRLFLQSTNYSVANQTDEYSTFKYNDHGYISQYRHWDIDYSETPELSVFRNWNSEPVTDGREIDIDDAFDYLDDGYSMDIDYTYDSEGRCTQASWWHIKADGSRGVEIARVECKPENGRWMQRCYSWEEEEYGQYNWCAPGVEGYNQWGDREIEGEYDHSAGHDSYDKFYEYEEKHYLRKLSPDEYISEYLDISDADICDFVLRYRESGRDVRAYRIELSSDKLSAVIYRARYNSWEHNDQPMPLADLDKYWEVYSRHSRSSLDAEWHTEYDDEYHYTRSAASAPEYHVGYNRNSYWEDFEGNYSEVRTDKFCWMVEESVNCESRPIFDEQGLFIGEEIVIVDGRKMRNNYGTPASAPALPRAPEYKHAANPFDYRDEYDIMERAMESEMFFWRDGAWYLSSSSALTGEYNNAGDYVFTEYTADDGKRVARNIRTFSFDTQHRISKYVSVNHWYGQVTEEVCEYAYNSDGLIQTETSTVNYSTGQVSMHVIMQYTYIANPYYVPSSADTDKQAWGTTEPFYVSTITWTYNGMDFNGDGILTGEELDYNQVNTETYNYAEGTYVDPQMDFSFLGIQSVPSGSADAFVSRFFDIQGRRHTSLRQGLNLVRTSDGRVTKVLVK